MERNLVLAGVTYVGVPAVKRHGKKGFGIVAPDNWLLIYKLFGRETVDERRDIKNQLGDFKDIRFFWADAFAIPSKCLYWQELSEGEQ